jgi:3-methyladenine DNA glycosylase AlkD
MKSDILFSIRKELKENVDARTKNSCHRFFKEHVICYGVKTAIVGTIAQRYFELLKQSTKQEIFSLCDQLLESDYCEEAYIAFTWAYRLENEYEPSDFRIFEDWITKYVNNWAKCDTLCNHAVGVFIEKYPQYIANLKVWAQSDNRWLKRASAVTLILPARKGKFLNEIFEIADSLLRDDDDLVQKGYGWMLKEASKLHPKEVFDYVMSNQQEMPRTALRYAIEKLPQNLKATAMRR